MYDLDGNLIFRDNNRYLYGFFGNSVLRVQKDKIFFSMVYDRIGEDGKKLKKAYTKDYCYKDTGTKLELIWSNKRPEIYNIPYPFYLIRGAGDTYYSFSSSGQNIEDKRHFWNIYDANGKAIDKIEYTKFAGEKSYFPDSGIYPRNTFMYTGKEETYWLTKKELIKRDKKGNKIWSMSSLDEDHYKIISRKAGYLLAESGNVYFKKRDTLRCADSGGRIIWKAAHDGADWETGYIAGMNHRGDLFFIDEEQIYCFRGIGDKLDLKGWSRLYYDYGNTCFKP